MPETSTGAAARLSAHEFERIRQLARVKFGLDLKEGKQELVAARLGKKMREQGFASYREYCDHVIADSSGSALIDLVDALTTNFTSFLREPAHFEFLRESILPDLKGRDPVTVWCAACATGEEAYSIAFCLLEELGRSFTRCRVLATDISTRALAAAEAGVYPGDRAHALPPDWVRRYLLRGEGQWKGSVRVKPEVRRVVEFRRLNLMEALDSIARVPVIFCRNVMIYFDRQTQEDLVRRLTARLEIGGYLLTGHSESLVSRRDNLQYVRPAVYRKTAENGSR
jgi:chemotaxis protein methyltransferase CheR